MMNVNQTTFVYYTEEQKEEARQIDIMDFLAKYEGFTFERVGHEYHCREHNSLVINADHKRWFWNSKEMGGHDAISYLQKIHNMDYRITSYNVCYTKLLRSNSHFASFEIE